VTDAGHDRVAAGMYLVSLRTVTCRGR